MKKVLLLNILLFFMILYTVSAQNTIIEPISNISEPATRSSVFYVKQNDSNSFDLKDLIKLRKPNGLSMELALNPAWYIIPALPYLIDNQNQSTAEIFNGFFANSVALYLLNKEVGLDSLMKRWEYEPASGSPENEIHRRIGKLMDTVEINNRMADEIKKLNQAQLPDGSWPWFPGMKSNRYITQIICKGIGRLYDMHIYDNYSDRLNDMGVKAFKYCDDAMTHDYNVLVSQKVNLDENHLTADIISYLYARTFWNVPIDFPCERALYYWQEQAWNNYQNRSLAEKAMLIAAFYRQGEDSVYIKIFRSVDKQSIHDDNTGVFWKENTGTGAEKSETQSLLMEAYNLMRYPVPDYQTVKGITKWFLHAKTSNYWTEDFATADAVYALNLSNYIPFITDKLPKVKIGNSIFDTLAGHRAGYLYHHWDGNQITKEMKKLTVENNTDYPAWIDFNITDTKTNHTHSQNINGLKVKKTVYYMKRGIPGKWKKLSKNQQLNAGDSLKIQIDINAVLSQDYIHLQNLTASNTKLSDTSDGIKNTSGLIYYKKVNESNNNIYIEHLEPKKYQMSYTMSVTRSGKFQNGGIFIEKMY